MSLEEPRLSRIRKHGCREDSRLFTAPRKTDRTLRGDDVSSTPVPAYSALSNASPTVSQVFLEDPQQ